MAPDNPILPLDDDRLVQNNLDPRGADGGAVDRVSHIVLAREVPSHAAGFMLRDRENQLRRISVPA